MWLLGWIITELEGDRSNKCLICFHGVGAAAAGASRRAVTYMRRPACTWDSVRTAPRARQVALRRVADEIMIEMRQSILRPDRYQMRYNRELSGKGFAGKGKGAGVTLASVRLDTVSGPECCPAWSQGPSRAPSGPRWHAFSAEDWGWSAGITVSRGTPSRCLEAR